MPAHNAAPYIGEAIASVQGQTYPHWELLVVDDQSTDETRDIVRKLAGSDLRIKLIESHVNMGAGEARNLALGEDLNVFVAFLDSDDLWDERKLEIQIEYMGGEGVDFLCTSYGKLSTDGLRRGVTIAPPLRSGYWRLLLNCPCNSSVMYRRSAVGSIRIPSIRKRNDYAFWLLVIKKTGTLYGVRERLAYHRERPDSISANKLSLVKYHWWVYRSQEDLNFVLAAAILGYWTLIKPIGRRMAALGVAETVQLWGLRPGTRSW